MEINLHYASRFDEKQIMELRSIGIDVDADGLSDLVCFDIFQNSEQHLRLKEKFPNISNPVKWYVFSEEEMQAAEWFTMRSTNESWRIPAQRKLSLTAVTRAIIMIRR